MGTLIQIGIGFALGVAYMNGTLGEFLDITVNLLNSGAEAVAQATEPTHTEKLEKLVDKYTD